MRKGIKEHPIITILIFLIVIAITLTILIGGYRFNWAWTGFTGATESYKTLYDWLQLLIIPAAIAIVGLWFSKMQKNTEQRIAIDNQKEEALKEYINEMSTLLFEKNLRKSKSEDEASIIGRVRTLTVLHRLDSNRKKAVIQFLYESDLIQKGKCIIKLKDADLYEANLIALDLTDAELSGAKLILANLRGANLRGADLSNASLLRAKLYYADLTGSDLSNANMNYVDLTDAIVTDEQLAKAKFLKQATMPDGSIHE